MPADIVRRTDAVEDLFAKNGEQRGKDEADQHRDRHVADGLRRIRPARRRSLVDDSDRVAGKAGRGSQFAKTLQQTVIKRTVRGNFPCENVVLDAARLLALLFAGQVRDLALQLAAQAVDKAVSG